VRTTEHTSRIGSRPCNIERPAAPRAPRVARSGFPVSLLARRRLEGDFDAADTRRSLLARPFSRSFCRRHRARSSCSASESVTRSIARLEPDRHAAAVHRLRRRQHREPARLGRRRRHGLALALWQRRCRDDDHVDRCGLVGSRQRHADERLPLAGRSDAGRGSRHIDALAEHPDRGLLRGHRHVRQLSDPAARDLGPLLRRHACAPHDWPVGGATGCFGPPLSGRFVVLRRRPRWPERQLRESGCQRPATGFTRQRDAGPGARARPVRRRTRRRPALARTRRRGRGAAATTAPTPAVPRSSARATRRSRPRRWPSPPRARNRRRSRSCSRRVRSTRAGWSSARASAAWCRT